MPAFASANFNAIADAVSGSTSIGMAMTLAAGGQTYTPATTAALAASPSGVIEGVAVMQVDPGRTFVLQVDGRLSPAQAPFVGLGNATDYAIVDATANIRRSSAYVPGLTIGQCGKDGSVTIILNATSGVVGPTSQANLVGSGNTGDVITLANSPTDPTAVTVATTSALANGIQAVGILLTPSSNSTCIYAAINSTVDGSITGLSSGIATHAVVSANRVVRKNIPDPTDYIVGNVDIYGRTHLLPTRTQNGPMMAGSPPYNPDPTGVTGATAALQAAINDAPLSYPAIGVVSFSRQIDIPTGLFLLDKPLRISTQRTILHGSGHGGTYLAMTGVAGPAIHITPVTTPYPVTPNAFAGGNAAQIRQVPFGSQYFMEISEYGAGWVLNGLSSFSVECIIQRTADDSIDGYLVMSYGLRKTTEAVGQAMSLLLTGSGSGVPRSVQFGITTTGGFTSHNCTLANVVPADSAPHSIQATYDGSFARIYIDGSLVLQEAQTGTIVQTDYEYALIGRGQAARFGQGQNFATPNCDMASIRTSNNARNTSGIAINGATNASPIVISTTAAHGFTNGQKVRVIQVGGNTAAIGVWTITTVDSTHFSLNGSTGNSAYTSGGYASNGPVAPTVKYTLSAADTNLLWGCNFDSFYDIFTVATCLLDLGGSRGTAYIPNLIDSIGAGGAVYDCRIENMTIISSYGECVLAQESPKLIIRDVYANGKQQLRLRDNCFNATLQNCVCNSTGFSRRIAIFIGNAGYYTAIRDCSVSAATYGVVSYATDLEIYGPFYVQSCKNPCVFIFANSIGMYGNVDISDEGSFLTLSANIMLIGVAAVEIGGCQITSPNSPAAVLVDINTRSFFTFETRVKFTGCYLAVHPTLAPGWARLAPDPNSFGSLEFDHCTFIPNLGGAVPILDPASTPAKMALLVTPKRQVETVSQAIGGLTTYTITEDQWSNAIIQFTGVLTANCVLTSPARIAGPKVIRNSTTGAFTLTIKAAGSSATPITCSAGRTTVQSDGTDLF